MSKDIHGQALLDYFHGEQSSELHINNLYGEPEEMPVEHYFRNSNQFTELEKKALEFCSGKILDIGSAAGSHALALQNEGKDVTTLEISEGCVEVMKARGLKQVVLEDYRNHRHKYDTLILLMNGIGIAGTLNEIPDFLTTCKKLLNAGGQIILDSSDIKYLYEDSPDIEVPYPYYGDIRYQYEYKDMKGEWFDWVYADGTMLEQIVLDKGLQMEVLEQDEYDQFLARITGF